MTVQKRVCTDSALDSLTTFPLVPPSLVHRALTVYARLFYSLYSIPIILAKPGQNESKLKLYHEELGWLPNATRAFVWKDKEWYAAKSSIENPLSQRQPPRFVSLMAALVEPSLLNQCSLQLLIPLILGYSIESANPEPGILPANTTGPCPAGLSENPFHNPISESTSKNRRKEGESCVGETTPLVSHLAFKSPTLTFSSVPTRSASATPLGLFTLVVLSLSFCN